MPVLLPSDEENGISFSMFAGITDSATPESTVTLPAPIGIFGWLAPQQSRSMDYAGSCSARLGVRTLEKLCCKWLGADRLGLSAKVTCVNLLSAKNCGGGCKKHSCKSLVGCLQLATPEIQLGDLQFGWLLRLTTSTQDISGVGASGMTPSPAASKSSKS